MVFTNWRVKAALSTSVSGHFPNWNFQCWSLHVPIEKVKHWTLQTTIFCHSVGSFIVLCFHSQTRFGSEVREAVSTVWLNELQLVKREKALGNNSEYCLLVSLCSLNAKFTSRAWSGLIQLLATQHFINFFECNYRWPFYTNKISISQMARLQEMVNVWLLSRWHYSRPVELRVTDNCSSFFRRLFSFSQEVAWDHTSQRWFWSFIENWRNTTFVCLKQQVVLWGTRFHEKEETYSQLCTKLVFNYSTRYARFCGQTTVYFTEVAKRWSIKQSVIVLRIWSTEME